MAISQSYRLLGPYLYRDFGRLIKAAESGHLLKSSIGTFTSCSPPARFTSLPIVSCTFVPQRTLSSSCKTCTGNGRFKMISPRPSALLALRSQSSSSQQSLQESSSTSQSSTTVDPFKLAQSDLDNLFIDIRKELNTVMPELKEISSYYFDGQGKAIRPLIIILTARAFNFHLSGKSELLNSQKRVSLIIEMIHTASLIHDDVIDSADTRRGKPSVNVLWGQKKSIFAGDFVISRGSQMLARLNSTVLISLLSEAIIDLVLGEFMQMGSKEDVNERFAHYIQKTFKKTASLIAYTCKSVSYLSGANEELQEAAFQYGRNLGIAFQLVDDLLDFVSNQAELGKPAANDLKLGLATAPVLFACEKFPELNEMIIRRFSEPGDVEKAYDAVMKSDGIYHTRMLARKHADEAARHIAQLADCPEKQALMVLCDMVLNRKK